MRETARRTIVRGGTVVSPSGTAEADVLLVDGVIAAVAATGALPVAADREADVEVIDAAGMLVLPGGVDVHTHLDAVFRGSVRTADDFASGTAAAVAGGTTTIIDFCRAEEGESLTAAVAGWRARVAAQRPWADYGAHMILVQPGARQLAELAELPAVGVSSVKLYLAYPGRMMSDDHAVLRTMQRAAETGLTVLVHAENGHAIDVLVEDALDAGNTGPAWHGKTRPVATEAEAVGRAAMMATLAGAQLYIVHVSSAAALDEIARARRGGARVHAETCSHYLVFDETMLEEVPHEVAARFVCSPPTRARDDQETLWKALASRELDVLASDHCPFALNGEKVVDGDFTHIMNGLPGVEQRLLIAYQGVADGRFPISRMVDIVSTTPARVAGIHPRKGEIAVGSDADLVIFDPAGRTVLSAATHHSAADYLPYEGMDVAGRIHRVLLGGRTVYRDGVVSPEHRHGAFLHRSPLSEGTPR